MGIEVWLVLLVATCASLGLLYYVGVYLPAELDRRFQESLRAFGLAIELRFPARAGLTKRTEEVAVLIAKKVGLSNAETHDLRLAAQLKDIGLCAMPYKLLNEKAQSQWSASEWSTYERHPEVSAAMLELVPSVAHLASVVRNHAAFFDGSSGPFHPAREDLPMESRILCTASTFAWNEHLMGWLLAKESLHEESGTRHDPKVVEALLTVLTSGRARDSRPQKPYARSH